MEKTWREISPRTLLESTCRFRETHELEERLHALEERLGKVS